MVGVAPVGKSTVHVVVGIDRDFLENFAQTHERAGFDAALVGYSASSAEGFQVAQFWASRTQRGTPDQVADAVVKYYALGVSGVLLRGFDPVADAEDYGRELIPLIRKKVAAADGHATSVATVSVAG
jgi:alkanesulfonate monooxygenase SsuD/methylene tetrahydromethanopterin reductase-like flavin-dependent oxidoreductase (luciferase family)